MTCSYEYGGTTRWDTCAVTVNYQMLWFLYMSPSSYTFYSSTPKQFKCLARVGTGQATPLKSLIFTDMLNAYRRIKDHALNIAEVLAGEK